MKIKTELKTPTSSKQRNMRSGSATPTPVKPTPFRHRGGQLMMRTIGPHTPRSGDNMCLRSASQTGLSNMPSAVCSEQDVTVLASFIETNLSSMSETKPARRRSTRPSHSSVRPMPCHISQVGSSSTRIKSTSLSCLSTEPGLDFSSMPAISPDVIIKRLKSQPERKTVSKSVLHKSECAKIVDPPDSRYRPTEEEWCGQTDVVERPSTEPTAERQKRCSNQKRKLYRSEQISNAVADIKAGISTREAAQKWKVPRTTLQNRKRWISRNVKTWAINSSNY